MTPLPRQKSKEHKEVPMASIWAIAPSLLR